jgi:hypothetical protein
VRKKEFEMSIVLLIAAAGIYLAWPRGLIGLLRSVPRSNDDFQI